MIVKDHGILPDASAEGPPFDTLKSRKSVRSPPFNILNPVRVVGRRV